MEVVQLICHKDGRTWSERKSFNILICFATSCSTIEAAHGLEQFIVLVVALLFHPHRPI